MTKKLFKRSKIIFSSSVLIVITHSQMCLAWGDLGHQTVAEIAQRNLSPKAKIMVSEILGHGPLAEAAIFPDLVRSDEDYKEFSSFHFIEIDPRWGTYQKIPFYLKEKRDANSLISNIPTKLFENILSKPKFNKNQRQDLLRYLVHLVGDVHQPLHVGNGFDRGGNWCQIKYPISKNKNSFKKEDEVLFNKSNLHSFWDSTLVENIFYFQKTKNPNYKIPSWKGYVELADLILSESKPAEQKSFQTLDIYTWYAESQELHTKVYPDKNKTTLASERSYCQRLVKDEKGEIVKDDFGVAKIIKDTDVAELDDSYMLNSAEIIKQQILKAGLRLAAVMNDMAQKNYQDPTESFEESKLNDLKMLLNEFNNSTK